MTRICVVARQQSDATALLCAVAAEASSLGADVGIAGGGFPSEAEPAVYVFSPSDLAGDRRAEGMPSASQLGRSIALCAERPGTERFGHSAALSRRAGATMDISTPALAEHRRRGTVAERFALGYAAAWDRWGNDSESERTMDVLFTGSLTDRRWPRAPSS